MKNELTAEEWLALDEYLTHGTLIYDDWYIEGVQSQKQALLESAEIKINKVAEEIRNGK